MKILKCQTYYRFRANFYVHQTVNKTFCIQKIVNSRTIWPSYIISIVCTIENFRKYGASVKLPRLQSRLPLQIVYIVTVVFVIKH